MAESPALGPRLLEMTLDELDAAREWMLVLSRKSARERIATLLYLIATRSRTLRESDGQTNFTFELPLTRETLADYLGLTIETVSRQFTALRKDKVIELKKASGKSKCQIFKSFTPKQVIIRMAEGQDPQMAPQFWEILNFVILVARPQLANRINLLIN